jgi:23S rRNA (adenine2503-C2)-methyltransferase
VKDLLGLDRGEIAALVKGMGLPEYRAKQIFHWVQNKGISSIKDMTNIPKDMRVLLEKYTYLSYPEIVARRESAKGDTIKFLLRYSDGANIETVLMIYERYKNRDRNTVCISSQVGCNMGCGFCATGISGFERNLSAGEIVSQVWVAQRECLARNISGITNVVFMGMGEPLANLPSVIKSILLLNDSQGLNIGLRHMTISTCGLIPGIYRLADIHLPVNLAISLHAANNMLRDRLMPVNQRFPVEKLIKAADYYAEKTGRRVTYEYALFQGINDSEKNARELGKLLKGHLAHLNIIPANPVKETGMARSRPEVIEKFIKIVSSFGVSMYIREEKGVDIDAACGQLRRHYDLSKQ